MLKRCKVPVSSPVYVEQVNLDEEINFSHTLTDE